MRALIHRLVPYRIHLEAAGFGIEPRHTQAHDAVVGELGILGAAPGLFEALFHHGVEHRLVIACKAHHAAPQIRIRDRLDVEGGGRNPRSF